METLFELWPFIVFFLIVFIDKSAAKKRREERREQEQYEQREVEEQAKTYEPVIFEGNKEQEIPWYIEFPEDRETKKQEPIIDIAPAKEFYTEKPFMEPIPEVEERKDLPADSFEVKTAGHRRAVRDKVLQGVIMAEVLDKPRALKPYGNN